MKRTRTSFRHRLGRIAADDAGATHIEYAILAAIAGAGVAYAASGISDLAMTNVNPLGIAMGVPDQGGKSPSGNGRELPSAGRVELIQ